MSKQACKRLRKHLGLPVNREPLPAFAWPGGYPLFYVFADGGSMCPKCVNANVSEIDADTRAHREYTRAELGPYTGWELESVVPNWEDPQLHCDHCGERIPSAYADDVTSEGNQ